MSEIKRGDLVEVRWDSRREFDDLCVVLDAQRDVRGGSWIHGCRHPQTGETWNEVIHVERGDLLLVCEVGKGIMSWRDCSNARLVSPS